MRPTLPTTTAPGTTRTTGRPTTLSRARTSTAASGERRQFSSHLKTGRRSQPGWRGTEASMVMEGVTPARGDVLAGDNRSRVGGGRDPRRSSRRRDELQPLWPRRKGEEGKVEGLGSLWES